MVANRADGVRVACPLFQEEGSGSIPTSALDLEVIEIGAALAQDLNRLWHSVLPDTYLGNLVGNLHNVFYGCLYRNVYYAVAMWTDPIAGNRMKDAKAILELRRFAIAPDAPKNTASRVLRVMAMLIADKFPDIRKLVSYQAIECHKGTIYKAAGWRAANTSSFKEWKDRPGDGTRKRPQIESDMGEGSAMRRRKFRSGLTPHWYAEMKAWVDEADAQALRNIAAKEASDGQIPLRPVPPEGAPGGPGIPGVERQPGAPGE